ncbi:microcephalin isoform X2 [Cololabis saira]|uniref:microcephalin isoform X2 n=1 Tax=Cololabis saira TaxID=129043 RepID=UPI002AD431AF|nr:microcephalin isoform X2 [Cololabis saira]
MTTNINSSVLKDVIAYVDVWSSDKRANYSQSFIQQLEGMGARVSKRFNKQVTHVVFQNGHPATWRKAKQCGVQLVSVLWVSRCYDDAAHVDEELCPAINDETNPVMKNRKHRCMLPKDSPEKTTENDWRMRKKFDKMLKGLTPKKHLAEEMSPIIIDEENGIIYSPGLKRSESMAQRLKEMKHKRENLSPTASQMSETCSPTALQPSLGSTPTVFKFKLDDLSDDDSCAFVADRGVSPDKEDGRSHSDFGNSEHLESDSLKPWLSPLRDVPKRIQTVLDCHHFEEKEDKEGNEPNKSITSVRKKAAEKPKSGDFLESPLQERSDKSKTCEEKKQSRTRSSTPSPNKKARQKMGATKLVTDTESHIYPECVNSVSTLSSSNLSVDTSTRMSKKACLVKTTDRKATRRNTSTPSAFMGALTLLSLNDSKHVASSSTDGDDVFDDCFSQLNLKSPVVHKLPENCNIQLPFELGSSPKKRRKRRETFGSETNDTKRQKLAGSHRGKNPNQFSGSTEPQSLQQQDGEISIPPLDSYSANVMTRRQRRQTFTSAAKTSSEGGKPKQASTPGQLSLQSQDPSHSLESGGDDCMAAAGFTQIPLEAEGNHKKPDSLTLQKMVNKTKICRLQRHLSAGEHQQDLFQSQPAMFVSHHAEPPAQSLVELIQLCGGTVCKSVRQAGLCIGKYGGRRPEGSKLLSEQWILDSISNLKILSYDNYDLE